jgi:hypothetical protein
LEITSTAGAQEVKPRAVRPPKNAAQPAPKPHVAAVSPEDCGMNSAIYWAGSGPKVHVIRQGTLTQRKPLDSTSPLTQMVVLEVRILDKLAATYGPSFEGMRRSGPPNQVEEERGAREESAARSGNPATGRNSMIVPKFLVGAQGTMAAASRAEYGCRISASRFTRSLSVLWHASDRNWHPVEARGKSFF